MQHALFSFADGCLQIQKKGVTSHPATPLLQVGGNEDIPVGVTAVLSQSPTDVLSHVAIRARCQGVLLAACFDDAEFQMLRQLRVRVTYWWSCFLLFPFVFSSCF